MGPASRLPRPQGASALPLPAVLVCGAPGLAVRVLRAGVHLKKGIPWSLSKFNGTITVPSNMLASRRSRVGGGTRARARWWRVLRAGVHLGKGIPWSRRVEVSPHHVPRLHSSSYGAHVQWDHEGALRLLASPVGGGARARARALQGCCALGCTWGKVFHGPLV